MNKLLILLIFLLTQASWAISEKNYDQVFQQQVWPYFQSYPEAKFVGFQGVELNYRKIVRGKENAVVIMGGRTEPIDKYAELAFDLREENIDIFLLDSRGQGRSERLLEDSQKGYVHRFKDYSYDLQLFVQTMNLKKNYKNVIFLAHSMGGAIGLQTQQMFPGLFDGMIMSAPMIEILLRDRTESSTLKLLKILKLIGKKRSYIPGGGPVNDYWSFEENTVTHSYERHSMARWLTENDPHLLMGSSTINWVYESLKAGQRIFKNRDKLGQTPMLMFQAQKEHFSRYNRQTILCRENINCIRQYIFGAKHEVFQEIDNYRNQVLEATKNFLRKYN